MKAKYILFDILNTEKNMKINMACALNEASCDVVYDLYYKIFERISDAAKDLFTLGYNNSWYQLDQTTKTKISENHTKLKNELEEA